MADKCVDEDVTTAEQSAVDALAERIQEALDEDDGLIDMVEDAAYDLFSKETSTCDMNCDRCCDIMEEEIDSFRTRLLIKALRQVTAGYKQ